MSKSNKKYKGLTPEEIRADAKRQKKASIQYSIEYAEVEDALTNFMEQKDPIVWNNKAIAWVCRPTMKQLKALVPAEMKKYADNPEAVPEELNKKYEGFFYKKMAEMIAIPKRSAKEWEEKANPWFIRLFWGHIAEMSQLMEGQVDGFLEHQ